jgi:hypothetical protein
MSETAMLDGVKETGGRPTLMRLFGGRVSAHAVGSARIVGSGETLASFIEREMPLIPRLATNPLTHVLAKHIPPEASEGLWLEFGVATGSTLKAIANAADDLVYGFDSFTGLPETWRPGFAKGAFDMDGKLPSDLPANVRLVPGWFDASLPAFLHRERPYARVAFAHIDCDLYSSTKTVLQEIGARLLPGAVLVFDELVDYPGYDEHEIKALFEFPQGSKRPFQWIGAHFGNTPLAVQPAKAESADRQKVAIRIF